MLQVRIYYPYIPLGGIGGHMKYLKISIVFILAGILIYAWYPKSTSSERVLRQYGFDQLSVEELAYTLDKETFTQSNLIASITATSIAFGEVGKSVNIDIPEGKFYLSLAPYIEHTHPCANHNFVTCRGEMPNTTFHVKIVTLDDEVLIDEELTTYDNGFVGVWLPANITANIYVHYQNKSANTTITTLKTSDTCLTTLQLEG